MTYAESVMAAEQSNLVLHCVVAVEQSDLDTPVVTHRFGRLDLGAKSEQELIWVTKDGSGSEARTGVAHER